MRIYTKITLAVFAIFFISGLSFASNVSIESAIQSGQLQINKTLQAVAKNVRNRELVEKSIEEILKVATQTLKENGYHKKAKKINLEWKKMSVYYFHNTIQPFDLGDHAPLNQWLADTYNQIEELLGETICRMTHLDDIKAINYGFPVTIHPEGDPLTHQRWGSDEYSKHFVPFTTAVTYWAGDLACSVALDFVGSIICSTGLEIPRFLIENFIAPPLSYQIYFQFNPDED